jgi:hypothetical protein
VTPMIRIRKRDRCNEWLTLDFRDDEDIEAVIVVPAFGPDHRAGMDCWCQPNNDEGPIVHNECH